MHICMDEVRCLLALFPEIRFLIDRFCMWWRARKGHCCSHTHNFEVAG